MSAASLINIQKKIVVIGAGVVGLTTAIKIQEAGYSVIIIAETFPTDPKTIRYTSHWAGAHHVSFATADDPRQVELDRETFQVMWEMSEQEADGCFLRIVQTEYYHDERTQESHLNVMPNFRCLENHELAVDAKSGVTFSTVTIDVPTYLNYLLSRFLAKGGAIQRASVQHISQVAEGGFCQSPDAIIVCAGLGTRILGGVEDKDVYPIRGQTVLLRAPWIRFGKTQSIQNNISTYIIPRRSGDVIIGGTKIDNDWYPRPRPETTEDILTRALTLCPELVPQSMRKDIQQPSIDDIKPLIIEEGCGLRPGRKGGIRLETSVLETTKGNKLPLVYNYGHAGFGYQSSWGSASVATNLLESALGK